MRRYRLYMNGQVAGKKRTWKKKREVIKRGYWT